MTTLHRLFGKYVAAAVPGIALCVLASLHVATARAAAPAGFDFERTPGLLSNQVVPSHYALALQLDPASERFSGTVRIDLRVRAQAPAIVLHAYELEATKVALHDAQGSARDLEVAVDAATRTWRLAPRDGKPIVPGSYVLHAAWQGKVERTGQGLFAVDYASPQGPARMLATQFEPRHARRMLPCFDEPAFRATFEVSVSAPRGYEVLSNTPVAGQRRDGDTTRWRFARTPSMPSYLLAVSVGRFERLTETIDDVRVSVIVTSGKREQGRFAMHAMRQILPYMRRYFGIAYALPKLDLLAVPGVRGGAMEDWGLMSFNEALLLVDARDSAPQKREWVYELIAHEVAHQWFGNLVTAAWWDEIWLNEAFATWLAEKTSARFNPAWKGAQTRRLDRADALLRDATPATRAIRSGPVSEDAVFDVFDEITYAKGGAVLSMLEDWLGAERFRGGLATYMRERQYSNATAGDLWRHLARAAGRDVQAVVSSWTEQPGYPVIDVQRECRDGRTVLSLSQSAFKLSEFDRPLTWHVPLRIRHGDERRFLLLDAPAATLEWPGCDALPIVVNAGDTGFCRVRYAPHDTASLLDAMPTLSPADRLMLQDDAHALGVAGRQPIALYLQALKRLPGLPGDAAHVLALQAAQGIDAIDEALAGSAARAPFAAFARSVLAPLLHKLGWRARNDDDLIATRLRSDLIEQLGRLGDKDVQAKAADMARTALAGDAPLEPTIREAVLGAAGAGANESMFALLASALRKETRDERRWELARAIGSVQDGALAERALGLALDEQLPAQIVGRLPSWLSKRGRQPERAFEFALRNYDALARRSPEWGRVWILPGAAEGAASASAAAQLLEQQRQRTGVAGRATAEQIAAAIELKARFREREAGAIGEALAGNGRPPRHSDR